MFIDGYTEMSISAQKPRNKHRKDEGPTVFTLARKAEILNDEIIVPKHGQPRLKRHRPMDAVDALTWLRAKFLLSEGEWMAGTKLARMRRRVSMLLKHGVAAPPSFFRAMVSEAGSIDVEETPSAPEELDDDEKMRRIDEAWEEYQEAVKWLKALSPQSWNAVHNVVCSEWWPESTLSIIALKDGLRLLAAKWKLEDRR